MNLRILFDKKALKFGIAGIFNTIFGICFIFGAYNFLGLNYWLSSSSAYFIGSILSFFLNKHYTFENKEQSKVQIVKFTLNIAVSYILAYSIAKPIVLFLLSDFQTNIQENIALLFGMGFFVILNYLGQRFIVFRG